MKHLRLLIALVVALASASAATGASAAPLPEQSGNAAGRCLASGQVWLLIVTDTGRVIANQCVGNPKTGEQALRNAGVSFTHKPDAGYICTIGGYPEVCRKKFNGQYWTYYQAQGTGDYHYSDWGANVYKPKPGAVEAWCYNKPDEYRCVPPKVKIVMPSESTPTPTPKPTPKPTTAPKPTAKPTSGPTTRPANPAPTSRPTGTPGRSTAKPTPGATTARPAATGQPSSTSSGTPRPTTATATPSAASPASAETEASPDASAADASTATAQQSMIEPNAPVEATPPPASSGTPVGVLVTGGVLALGGVGYGGWHWFRRRGL